MTDLKDKRNEEIGHYGQTLFIDYISYMDKFLPIKITS